jgi:KDO2-lipid IV(A) lauroyltransferase
MFVKIKLKKELMGVREAIRIILKKNIVLLLMIDQRVSEGEKINFFNKPAFTTTLPAQLAIKI